QVTEALLHARVPFRIAVEEDRDDAPGEFACDESRLRGLLARDGIRAERHRRHAEGREPDDVVWPLHQEEPEPGEVFLHSLCPELMLPEEFQPTVKALYEMELLRLTLLFVG